MMSYWAWINSDAALKLLLALGQTLTLEAVVAEEVALSDAMNLCFLLVGGGDFPTTSSSSCSCYASIKLLIFCLLIS